MDSICDSSLSNAAVFVPVTLVSEQDNGMLESADVVDDVIASCSSSNRLVVCVLFRLTLLMFLLDLQGMNNRCITCEPHEHRESERELLC